MLSPVQRAQDPDGGRAVDARLVLHHLPPRSSQVFLKCSHSVATA